MAAQTRRAVLGGTVTVAAAVSLPAMAGDRRADWPEFLRCIAFMHSNGPAAALKAREAGMDLRDLSMISLAGLGDTPQDRLPILMFKSADKRLRCFRPTGEDR